MDDVTLESIERFGRISRGFARKVAHDLVAKGWLTRVGRGRYLLHPSTYGPEAVRETDPLRVGSRLVRPYYFGYATAAELHGLLLQPGRVYYIVTPRRTPSSRRTGAVEFRLIRTVPRRFFGFVPLERRSQQLVVSDRERTVLDCLERPELSGGFGGAAQVLARAKPRLGWERLRNHLRRYGSRALAARLGFLAETLRPSVPAPTGWLDAMRPRSSDPWRFLGPPRIFGPGGRREPTWRLVRNVPDRVLFAEADTQ